MKQLNVVEASEAASALGQICRQAESGPACWFAVDLEASNPFSLAKLLGVNNEELATILKLAGVTKVCRNGVQRINKERLKEVFVSENANEVEVDCCIDSISQ
jgi:hypothetical protein